MIYEAINKMNSFYEKSRRYSLISHILFGLGAAWFVIGMITVPEMFTFHLIGGGFFWLACIIFLGPESKRAKNALRSEYKDTFLPGILNESFDNAKFEYWVGLTEMEVMQTSLYKLGNRLESEDLLTGEYKGVSFKQADVHIWNHVETEEENRDVEYFDGRIIMFDTKTDYSSSVRVISKPRTSGKGDYRLGFDEEHRVEMESMEFNDVFKVYARTGHDAFYILTPEVMERMMAIWRKYGRNEKNQYREMSFHLRDNKFYFAVETGNSAFEPSKFPICYPDEKAKLEKDIGIIMELIECFAFIEK